MGELAPRDVLSLLQLAVSLFLGWGVWSFATGRWAQRREATTADLEATKQALASEVTARAGLATKQDLEALGHRLSAEAKSRRALDDQMSDLRVAYAGLKATSDAHEGRLDRLDRKVFNGHGGHA